MKRTLLSAALPLPLFLFAPLTQAQEQMPEACIFNGYEEWYASLPDRMFAGDGEPLAVTPQHSVYIDGRHYRFQRGIAFPGENVYPGDLGHAATLYRSDGYYCVQGMGATSGTGSRHLSVYLVARTNGLIRKLPSLFASCLGIGRAAGGAATFLQAAIVNYRAAYDADGVTFTHHRLAGGVFTTMPGRLEVRFVEPGNFYRFVQRP